MGADKDVQKRDDRHKGTGQPATGDTICLLLYLSPFIINYAKQRGREDGRSKERMNRLI